MDATSRLALLLKRRVGCPDLSASELARRAVAFLFELEGVQVAVPLCTPSRQFLANLERLGSVCACESSNAPDLGRLVRLDCTAREA